MRTVARLVSLTWFILGAEAGSKEREAAWAGNVTRGRSPRKEVEQKIIEAKPRPKTLRFRLGPPACPDLIYRVAMS